jgi:AcrR family transcriptional regulator
MQLVVRKGQILDWRATGGLRERKKERLRQAILETSLQLFKERGYEQTRISDIAASVEIGEATLYRYFASKEAIVNEISAMAMQIPREQLAALRADASVEDHLRTVYLGVANQVLEQRWIFQLAGALPIGASLLGSDDDIASGLGPHLLGMIREAQRRGEIANEVDAATLADLFASMLSAAVLGWAKGDESAELQPRIEAVIRIFFHGVSK